MAITTNVVFLVMIGVETIEDLLSQRNDKNKVTKKQCKFVRRIPVSSALEKFGGNKLLAS